MPYCKSADVNIYYEIHGSGLPLMFLHGFTLDGRMWRDQVDYFKERYRVIICDARGHGRSEAPETGYAREDRAGDIHKLADLLNLTKFHLIGLSMGGGDAVSFAIDQQERLLSLTLAATVVSGWMPSKRYHDFSREAKEKGCDAALRDYMQATLGYYDKRHPALKKRLHEIMSDFSGGPWLDPMKGKYPKRDDLALVSGLEIPILIMAGQHDIYFRPLAERLHHLIKNSRLEILKDVGHMVNLENPAEFNKILETFLSAIELPEINP
nr:alpha/beta hydrolase [candidate division Zixibacteria bacterium]